MRHLTGGQSHVNDISRTLLLNIHTQQRDDELLALFYIPPAVLTQVQPSVSDLAMRRTAYLAKAQSREHAR